MRRVLVHLLRRHPAAVAALVLASAAFAFFAWQLVDGSRHASRPAEPALELWMSPRYVSRSWNLPKRDIFRVMEIDEEAGRDAMPRTLADVVARTGLTLEELQERVQAADDEDRRRRDGGRESGRESGRDAGKTGR